MEQNDIYSEIHTILFFEKTNLITIKLIVVTSSAKPKCVCVYIYI
jgi:hypothetical protein